MREYKVIHTGSGKKAEKELKKASEDGWELVEFRIGAAWPTYHYVFLLQRAAEGQG